MQMWEGRQARAVVLQSTGVPSGLTLAIPGVTIPWSHGLYLWLAALLSMSVHEVAFDLQPQASLLHYLPFPIATNNLRPHPCARVRLTLCAHNLRSIGSTHVCVCGS